MKKLYFLLIILLLCGLSSYGQEDCASALEAQVGSNITPETPYWYSYTASDNFVNVEISSVGTTSVDTYLRAYFGCIYESTNYNLGFSDNASGSQSRLSFDLAPNQTVYILWGDNNSTDGFDWTITETPISPSPRAQDSLALVDLYMSTRGSSWNQEKDNWLVTSIDEWQGITVQNERVIGIDLEQYGLNGFIPKSFEVLTELEFIRLNSNFRISGTIPPGIGSFENLREFSVGYNELEGAVPTSFQQLTNLEILELYRNKLEDLPDLSGLNNLVTFNVSRNRFQFDDLIPNIPVLDSYFNQRFGELTEYDLTSGENLNIEFDIGGSGNTYQWYKNGKLLENETNDFLNITSASIENVGRYSLTVNNPAAEEAIFSELIYISVNGVTIGYSCESPKVANAFTNEVEGGEEWFSVTANFDLYLVLESINRTNYDTEVEVYRECNTPLIASNDDFEGTLQSSVGFTIGRAETVNFKWRNKSNDESFDFYVSAFGFNPALESDSLALVDLYNSTNGENWNRNKNWLTGPVDTWDGIVVSEEGRVTEIELTNNGLTGEFPESLLELDGLEVLAISQASNFGGFLFGELPENFGDLQNLKKLYLTGNSFEGDIPESFVNMNSLETIAISGNFFENIPDLSNLPNLTEFEVGNNKLTFEDLEPNEDVLSGYLFQKNFGTSSTLSVISGEGETLTFDIGAINNSYQWTKNGNNIAGANSIVYEITDMNDSKTGSYRLNVTNSLFPDLTLTSQIITVNKVKAEQEISFNTIERKTILDADFQLTASTSSGLDVSYESSNTAIATVNGSTVSILAAGTTTITASQEGNDDFNAADPVEQTLTVQKADQNISFDPIANKEVADADFTIPATVSSGMTLNYSVSGPATETGGELSLTGETGTVTITASQAGDDNYNAAEPVTVEFLVTDPNKTDQTITFEALEPRTYGVLAINLSATASSDLLVSYQSSNPSVASVDGNLLVINTAGTTTITARQEGDGTFNPAAAVSRELVINKADQTISIGAIGQKEVGGPDFDIDATVGSGKTLTYAVEGPATVSDKTISIGEEAGTVTVTVSQAGDINYNPATVSTSFEVINNRSDQTISITAIADKFTNAAPFAVEASTTNGLALTYAVTGPATIEGATITLDGSTGTVEVTVSQAGNENFNPASASVSFEVLEPEVDPCLDFAATATATNLNCAGSADGSITVETTEGTAPFTYSLEGAAAVESNEFTALEAGEYSIEVMDANGCTATASATITSPDALEITAEVENSNSINGNGSINLTVTGGTGEYTYSWSNEATTALLTELEAGEYTVEVTDENGCSLEESFTIGGVTANSEDLAEGLLIFPNPAKDVVQVQHQENAGLLKLYDARGKLLNEIATEGIGSELNIAYLPSGLYFIRTAESTQLYRFVKK